MIKYRCPPKDRQHSTCKGRPLWIERIKHTSSQSPHTQGCEISKYLAHFDTLFTHTVPHLMMELVGPTRTPSHEEWLGGKRCIMILNRPFDSHNQFERGSSNLPIIYEGHMGRARSKNFPWSKVCGFHESTPKYDVFSVIIWYLMSLWMVAFWMTLLMNKWTKRCHGWMMDWFLRWPKPYLLMSRAWGEVLLWMIVVNLDEDSRGLW